MSNLYRLFNKVETCQKCNMSPKYSFKRVKLILNLKNRFRISTKYFTQFIQKLIYINTILNIKLT